MTISKTFKKMALGLALTTSMMGVAAPAMADNHCTAEEIKLTKPVSGHGIRVFDFSKAPEHCIDDFAGGTSGTYLTLVAESNSSAFRNATIDAARQLQSEGMRVQVVFGNDMDGLNTTAQTMAWANGVKRRVAPISIGGGFDIDHIDAAPQKTIDFIYEVGLDTWNTFLKVPEIAMNND